MKITEDMKETARELVFEIEAARLKGIAHPGISASRTQDLARRIRDWVEILEEKERA